MSTAITRAPRPFATRMPAPPIGPIRTWRRYRYPKHANRRWASNCVPTMSVITAPASKLISSGSGRQFPGHDDVVGIAAIDVEADALPGGAEEEISAAARLAVAAADAQIDRDTISWSDGGDHHRPRRPLPRLVARHDLAAAASPPTIGFP